jgi:hypothetical protein
MVPRKSETFEPVTMGHIRSHGCRDLLVYCDSGRCHHSALMNADWLPDVTPLRSLCSRMVCTKCGMIGADVRPDWERTSINDTSDLRALTHPMSLTLGHAPICRVNHRRGTLWESVRVRCIILRCTSCRIVSARIIQLL